MRPYILCFSVMLLWARGSEVQAQTHVHDSTEKTNSSEHSVIQCYEAEPKITNLREVISQVGFPHPDSALYCGSKVIVRIEIDENGNYLGHSFTNNPCETLKQMINGVIPLMKFSPGYFGEVAVPGWIVLPITICPGK